MIRPLLALAVLFLASPLLGDTRPLTVQSPFLREGDTLLSVADLQRLTAGNTLTFYDQGQSRFSPGGSYSYSYPDSGGTAFGIFRIEGGGKICIDFRNGRSRCDLYVQSGAILYVVTQQGDRFPFRTEFSLKP